MINKDSTNKDLIAQKKDYLQQEVRKYTGNGGITSVRTPNKRPKREKIEGGKYPKPTPRPPIEYPGGPHPRPPYPGKPKPKPYYPGMPTLRHRPKKPVLKPSRPWGETQPGHYYPAVEGPGNPSWEKRNPIKSKNYGTQQKRKYLQNKLRNVSGSKEMRSYYK